MIDTVITHVPGMVIPESLGLRREAPPRVEAPTDAFWERYDSTTLFYIAMHDAATYRLQVFAPPLLNFTPVVRRAQFFLEDQKLAPPRIIHGDKFDRLVFDKAPMGATLRMAMTGVEGVMPVLACEPARFAGRRVIYTMSKNNDLAWIRDWMVWYQRKHKADAVFFVDNDSTIYSADALAETLGAVEGYTSVALAQIPFRYGPDFATARRASYAQFLQTAFMNAFWMLSMRYARAMLNVDVDELIVSAKDEAIFDAVETARHGIVMATGHWRYPPPAKSPVRHRDHTLALPDDPPCSPKYCLRANSLAARQQLKVHGVKNFKRMPFVSRKDFTFLHCRNVSSSRRDERPQAEYAAMIEDSAAKTMLAQVFSETDTQ
ncbi:hypothetical protein [Pseudotabrizicola sp. 4114]|uniref:hypothetical protein n=1 Tax=Pseudotabrizicola sp. 4114 TaxID=2817731 RepID=UPI0028608871|nr:hypothetical protein [Pseudorhodobacter sp. 4114]